MSSSPSKKAQLSPSVQCPETHITLKLRFVEIKNTNPNADFLLQVYHRDRRLDVETWGLTHHPGRFICLFIDFFAWNWGSIGWATNGEIYPIPIRFKEVGLATACLKLALQLRPCILCPLSRSRIAHESEIRYISRLWRYLRTFFYLCLSLRLGN